MGIVLPSSSLGGLSGPSARERDSPGPEFGGMTAYDLLQKCSDLIGSTIAERIRELGGTDRDVRQLSMSAAYSVFVWSAGEVIRDH